jgi:hypothetical protein
LSINAEQPLLPEQGKVLIGWIQSGSYPALTHTATLTSTGYALSGEKRAVELRLDQAPHNTAWVTVYPNPSSTWTQFFVQGATDDDQATLLVNDANGRCILSTNTTGNPIQVNTTNWPPGCYSVTLRTAAGLHTAKMMKL